MSRVGDKDEIEVPWGTDELHCNGVFFNITEGCIVDLRSVCAITRCSDNSGWTEVHRVEMTLDNGQVIKGRRLDSGEYEKIRDRWMAIRGAK